MERAALAGSALAAADTLRVIESPIDPYARAGIGLSLLGLVAADDDAPAPSLAPGEWLVVVRAGLVGLAIALAAFELRVPAAIAFVTVLAAPRLWRARG